MEDDYDDNDNLYQRNVIKVTVICLITFIFSGTILLDSFLPLTHTNSQILKTIYYGRYGRYGSSHQSGIVTNGGRIPVPFSLLDDLTEGDTVGIEQTTILGLSTTFYYKGYIYTNDSIYFYYKIPFFILFLLSLFCLLMRKRNTLGLYAGVAISVVLFIILFFIFIDSVYVAPS